MGAAAQQGPEHPDEQEPHPRGKSAATTHEVHGV